MLSSLLIALWNCGIALLVDLCTDQGAASREIWRSAAGIGIWHVSSSVNPMQQHRAAWIRRRRLAGMVFDAAPLACASADQEYACAACMTCHALSWHFTLPKGCGKRWHDTWDWYVRLYMLRNASGTFGHVELCTCSCMHAAHVHSCDVVHAGILRYSLVYFRLAQVLQGTSLRYIHMYPQLVPAYLE